MTAPSSFDRTVDLIAAVEYGRLLVAYLSDIPANRITASPPAVEEAPLSLKDSARAFCQGEAAGPVMVLRSDLVTTVRRRKCLIDGAADRLVRSLHYP